VPLLSEELALSVLDKLHNTVLGRSDEVEKFDSYYRGQQGLKMASDAWRKFHARRYSRFSDNWCGVVTDAAAQRLRVQGIQLDADQGLSDAEKSLWSDWVRADMERQSAQGILETLKSRRSFVLVWPGDDGPRVTWEDPSQVAVSYDPEFPGRRVAAVKTWCDDETEYATRGEDVV